MNKVILMGRLTKDPETRYYQGEEPMGIARYTLAVDRRGAKNSDGQSADFIRCIAFRKNAEFAEKYFRKGIKIAITGRIQTSSYTDRYGNLAYSTEVVVEEQEFAESKSHSQRREYETEGAWNPCPAYGDRFIDIPEGIDEELPFN
ncbi:single-stranded DNA-binding protein [Roseburia sp. 1XD42-69]|uniref:single-stranded DNA-binding protein n=1 Tax=Roseburia sp. 1XD42-69 TaxID=2320088 RepID=UPI000EA0102F|nr:single-stranded DNA-binding protein [Roseburia sp. 1XD42-69]RKJ64900.1 single-stranded DNA-binding protein [Roseburia sp. 1XD42-69]